MRGRTKPERPLGRRGAALAAGVALAAVLGTAAARADNNRALGEYLSGECVTCHQLSGNYAGIPPIVGWPVDTFVEIMNEYREKTRNHQIMQTIAGRFSADEIFALAVYFSNALSKPVSAAPATSTRRK